MNTKKLFTILFAFFVVMTFASDDLFAKSYRFSGGPSGGTFQYYASAISTLAKKEKINVLASSSGGAIENIRTTNTGKSSFSVTYSGHVYAASNGKLKNDENVYSDVLAVSFLYGAPAQLVVKKKSGITSAKELADKRVGVGNAGSGAAANAEIFFTKLGIWDKMGRENLGYRAAADAFKNGQLDAFWVFVGYPNASVLEAALQNDVTLLDTYKAGEEAGLFEAYPYFAKVTIPANTYNGQTEPVNTFQDAALWVANKDVPADVVYNLLKTVYSEAGLKYMVEVHKSAKAMTIESGVNGIVTPLHPGAEKFWKEMGVLK
ncbi:MAG: C4-dicarboxylate ABC transporter substrate-binding protein [Calditrichaeota bacterium]|nr:MAG: C4-dicarboxylate ABC transporter substrate-binding protein [Calditrichota bacterium]